MAEQKSIGCRELMPAVTDILNNGSRVRITVTGNSMFPVLRMGRDSVELISAPGKYSRGDIVLIQKNDGNYVLHRIVEIRGEGFYLAGDAQNQTEGPFLSDQVIALVNGIWRDGRYLSANNPLLCFLLMFWIRLLPLRPYLLNFAHRVNSFIKRLS